MKTRRAHYNRPPWRSVLLPTMKPLDWKNIQACTQLRLVFIGGQNEKSIAKKIMILAEVLQGIGISAYVSNLLVRGYGRLIENTDALRDQADVIIELLSKQEDNQIAELKYCSACQTPQRKINKFCKKCGMPMDNANEANQWYRACCYWVGNDAHSVAGITNLRNPGFLYL